MDPLDVGILRVVGLDPYRPEPQGPDALKPGTIARALKVTPETVRERLQRMERTGVITGWQAYPNLRHLGLEASTYLFRTRGEDHRAALPQDLAPVEGLLALHTFLGPEVCVDVVYRGERELARRLQLLGNFTGDAKPEAFAGYPMPKVDRELTNLDWRIVRGLRGRARRSLAEVGEEVGVGYRTVKRHYDRLCKEGSLFTAPMLDPGRMEGVPFWVLYWVRPDAPKGAAQGVANHFRDRLIMGAMDFSLRAANCGVMLVADSPGQVEELRREAAAMPGVGRASVLVPVGLRDCSGWIDDLIEARVKDTAPG